MPDKEIENEADIDIDNNPSIEKIDDKSNDQSDAEKSGSLNKLNNIDAEIAEAPTQNKPDKDSENETNGKNIQPEDEHDTDITNREDIEELTLNEIDIPIDEFDEDEEKTGTKRKWLLIGSSIVLAAVIAGGGFFYFSNQDQTNKNNRNKEVALSLKIPSQSKLKKGRKKMISSSQKLLKSNSSSAALKAKNTPKQQNGIDPARKSQPDIKIKKPKNNKPKKKSANVLKSIKPKKDKKPAIKTQKKMQPISGAKILADGSLILPSVTAAAYKGIPVIKDPRPLADLDKSLGETVGGGTLPKISTDGRRPWKFYGKSFRKENNLPRVSIIIKGLGLSRAATTAAINHTPSEITLAFNPYAKGVGNWVGLARAVGHETLITLPMEPIDFPVSDPGPFALQVDLQQTENIDRLRYVLSVSMGNVGLLQMMGTRFVNSQKALEPILKEIQSRGLLMIDDGLTKKSQIVNIASKIGLPRARSDLFLDLDASRSGIIGKLAELEAIAKKNKSALGIAQPLPNSISLIMNWSETLEKKGLVLAPISAIVKMSGSLNLSPKLQK